MEGNQLGHSTADFPAVFIFAACIVHHCLEHDMLANNTKLAAGCVHEQGRA